MNIRLEKEIKYFENLKEQSFQNRNGLIYYNCCERLGIEPEDNLLYQHGLAEKIMEKKR